MVVKDQCSVPYLHKDVSLCSYLVTFHGFGSFNLLSREDVTYYTVCCYQEEEEKSIETVWPSIAMHVEVIQQKEEFSNYLTASCSLVQTTSVC